MENKTKYWLIGLGAGAVTLGVLAYLYRREIKGMAKETLGGYKWFNDSLKWYRNQQSRDKIENMHPKARAKFKEFLSRVEKELGLQVLITSGYRTWEHQARLKKENPSNASAGNSSHNYGFALDVNVMDANGNIILRKASSTSQWKNSGIVDIAKQMGFKWGGDFSSYHDPIHFYLEPIARSEMKNRYLAGQKDASGYVNIQPNEEVLLRA
jgi:D-alanyl-D-alanine carboxypeptidase